LPVIKTPFELCRYSDTAIRAETFDFGEEISPITFTRLMEDAWAQELARAAIVKLHTIGSPQLGMWSLYSLIKPLTMPIE